MPIRSTITRTIDVACAGARRLLGPFAMASGTDVQYWEDTSGRRRFRRVDLHGRWAELHILNGSARTSVRVRILDLSVAGARLSGGALADVEPGFRVRITVPLPDGTTLLGAPAGIVWVQHGLQGSTAGLEFHSLPPDDLRRLTRALAAGSGV